MLKSGPVALSPQRVWSDLRVTAAVQALCQLAPRARRSVRSLRVSGFFLAVSGLLMVWAANYLGAGDVSDVMALRITSYACWMYGVLGLWALLAPQALDLSGLGRLRGRPSSITLPAFLTISRVLWTGVASASLPGLALCVLLADERTRPTRWVQFFWCNIYIMLFALTLGLVGALCRATSARRARWIALLVLCLPYVFEIKGAKIPNFISCMLWGMGKLIALGAS